MRGEERVVELKVIRTDDEDLKISAKPDSMIDSMIDVNGQSNKSELIIAQTAIVSKIGDTINEYYVLKPGDFVTDVVTFSRSKKWTGSVYLSE